MVLGVAIALALVAEWYPYPPPEESCPIQPLALCVTPLTLLMPPDKLFQYGDITSKDEFYATKENPIP